ncbi:unnamed protein product [Owenia fusiformis]|uniref:Uncharacterized protein n=1 Tax=Owenia fusiformis TaxID=6347 RepID=A0A8J1TM60_OWEFU|nr:unnamed protein product [Owenia fusiformis]
MSTMESKASEQRLKINFHNDFSPRSNIPVGLNADANSNSGTNDLSNPSQNVQDTDVVSEPYLPPLPKNKPSYPRTLGIEEQSVFDTSQPRAINRNAAIQNDPLSDLDPFEFNTSSTGKTEKNKNISQCLDSDLNLEFPPRPPRTISPKSPVGPPRMGIAAASSPTKSRSNMSPMNSMKLNDSDIQKGSPNDITDIDLSLPKPQSAPRPPTIGSELKHPVGPLVGPTSPLDTEYGILSECTTSHPSGNIDSPLPPNPAHRTISMSEIFTPQHKPPKEPQLPMDIPSHMSTPYGGNLDDYNRSLRKNKPRSKTDHYRVSQREPEGEPTRPQRPGKHVDHGVTEGTNQLEFNQAMHDFRAMFPNMDEEVIEAVLRANNGAVDETIDQLLTMNVDFDATDSVPHTAILEDVPPQTVEEPKPLPPSYDTYLHESRPTRKSRSGFNSQTRHEQTRHEGTPQTLGSSPKYHNISTHDPKSHVIDSSHNIDQESSDWTPVKGVSKQTGARPKNTNIARTRSSKSKSQNSTPRAHGDVTPAQSCLHSHLQSTPRGKSHVSTPFPLPPQVDVDTPPSTIKHTHHTPNSHHKSQSPRSSTKKPPKDVKFRNWNPPMLGALPADFLRIIASPAQHHLVEVSYEDATPRPVVPPAQPSPEVLSKTRQKLASYSSSDLNRKIIQAKIAENERMRATTNIDPEYAKFLDDERFALLMQNEEFLAELRQDQDFMKTLESEGLNATAFERQDSRDHEAEPAEPVLTRKKKSRKTRTKDKEKDKEREKEKQEKEQEPAKDTVFANAGVLSTDPMDNMYEGYGEDNLTSIGAFPYSKKMARDEAGSVKKQYDATMETDSFKEPHIQHNGSSDNIDGDTTMAQGYGTEGQVNMGAFPYSKDVATDENEELKKQLKHMGGSSRRKLTALARKFMSKKKKKLGKHPLESRPSTINLLDAEEEDTSPERELSPNMDDVELTPGSQILSVPTQKTPQRNPDPPKTLSTSHQLDDLQKFDIDAMEKLHNV